MRKTTHLYLRPALLLAAVLLIAGFAAVPPLRAEVDFSVGLQINSPADFYDPLGPYGTWTDFPPYGRCWHPTAIPSDWRPYCEGHWEWTDAGWYWVSDEPWAWACYHYGSWTFDPTYGWLWIPGTEWAPSWVVWRESPDYIGWEPCGPHGAILGPSFFVFVGLDDFRHPIHRRELIIDNRTIIERSRVINNIHRVDRDFDGHRRRIAINRGPGIDPIERVSGAHLSPRPVTEVARQTPVPDVIRRRRESGGTARPSSGEHNRSNTPQRETPTTTRDQPGRPPARNQPPTVNQPPLAPTGNPQPRLNPERTRPGAPGGTRNSGDATRSRGRHEQSSAPAPQNNVQPTPPATPTPPHVTPPENQPRERGNRQSPNPPVPPTGRDQPRVFPERPTPAPQPTPRLPQTPPERRFPTPTIPQQPSRPAGPPPSLPPTGRPTPRAEPRQNPPGQAVRPQRPETAPPAARPPARPPATPPKGPPPDQRRDRDRSQDQ